MLRRTQSNAAIADTTPQEPAAEAAERLAAGRANRRNFETVRTELEQMTAPKNEPPRTAATWPEIERRAAKSERRGMDALRADALKAVISRVEDRNFGGLRNRFQWPSRLRIPPSRVALLLVAILAGGAAAFLATHRDEPAPAAVEQVSTPAPVVAPAPTTQILVATKAIGAGERLSADAVRWQAWPEAAMQSDYITNTATPEALTDMAGDVARFEIFPGEPISAAKIVKTDEGYLSVVLATGMRGVAVSVSPEAASGGFIVPNDHVDVVLTRTTPLGQESSTILQNVRVLAIGNRLGETGATGAPSQEGDPRADVFAAPVVATLEADPEGAETIINATMLGKLSLVLRSIDDFGSTTKSDTTTNQSIRMTSPFWVAK